VSPDTFTPPPGALEDPKVLLAWIVSVLVLALLTMFALRERSRVVSDARIDAILASCRTERESEADRRIKDREDDVRFRDALTAQTKATNDALVRLVEKLK
jgi:hypothetical protein